MLRVLIDATALPQDRGGVGRYVDELVAQLPGLGLEVHVAAQPRDRELYAALVGQDQVHTSPGWTARAAPRLVWEQVGLPLIARAVAPDVILSPHYTLPLISSLGRSRKTVVTLHDATFFSHPELHLGIKARFFSGWTRLAARRADALVVPSQSTKDELVRHAGARPDRLTVVPHGVDHERFRPPTHDEVVTVRAWLGLEQDASYLAFLGTLEPRKNVPALIRGYAAACRELLTPPVLVLAGGAGWDDGIEAALAAVPQNLTVLRPGFVPDAMVPALLGGAEVVAYPAFGEGFGLPVLEAMACGAAVLTTPMLSLPEVGGDAVAYAASPDAADIAEALAALLADPERRRRLAGAGIDRAARFTWQASAAAHRAVFETVVAR